TDKIVAANLVCTLTVNTICVLAAFRLEDYVLDIAILFTLLSFLSVQILCRVVSLHHKGRLRHLKDKHPEETAKEALDRLEREEEGHYHINEEAHV
ncbi:MAG: MrpF/PhaF family protein, partial [Oscillospiraceae bacterium]|nr:MrpF/PhaF family protein [Oscillospiraceae bacterium]